MYDAILKAYKEFLLDKSEYSPRVVKISTKQSSYFPIITFTLANNPENAVTQKNIDNTMAYFFTINIYAKDKVINESTISSQVIVEELRTLTIEFFKKLNMNKTLDQPNENLDTDVFRHTLNYQCNIDSRGNITRR